MSKLEQHIKAKAKKFARNDRITYTKILFAIMVTCKICGSITMSWPLVILAWLALSAAIALLRATVACICIAVLSLIETKWDEAKNYDAKYIKKFSCGEEN